MGDGRAWWTTSADTLSELNDVIKGFNEQIEYLMEQYEEMANLGALILIYEDIYTRIYDNDGRIVVRCKWRRLSILIDFLLYLSYLLTILHLKSGRPNRHVRGSRRSDL